MSLNLEYVEFQYIQRAIYLASKTEKAYAHFIGQASWAGARIIQEQWTPTAQKLYDLLILIFSDKGRLGDTEGLKQKSGVTAEEWDDMVQYTSQVCQIYPGSPPPLPKLSSLSRLIGYHQFGQL